MKRSLQRRLSMMLGLAVLACGVAAGLVAFYFSYSEAQEFQDDALRQVAALSIGSHSQIRQLDKAGQDVEDPESRIRVFRLPDGPSPDWLPRGISAGFHTLPDPGSQSEMRVFVRDAGPGTRIIVAQSTDSRNEIAINSALRTLVPLLLLLPILIGLIAYIVRGELTSLRKLSEHLDRQAEERPTRLPSHELPEEIAPFVEAINRLLTRVDKLIGEQRRFISDAAHELRTPLTALALQAQNLAQATSPEQVCERLSPLLAGIDRARKLTVQLLDLARLQAGEPAWVSVDASALARDLIAEFHPMAEARGIDLGLEAHELTSLHSDPAALRLIIRNGLENALKYTPAGGEVTVRVARDGNDAVIEIVDNGPGIPLPERARVFEPFYRRAGETEEGSGLGLAIAREAAVGLGARLSLHDRQSGSGLVFRFRQALQ